VTTAKAARHRPGQHHSGGNPHPRPSGCFAEHGVFAVSNRQVQRGRGGKANNAAVGYHFGTKTDLVRAIRAEGIACPSSAWRKNMVTEIVQSGAAEDMRSWGGRVWYGPPDRSLSSPGQPQPGTPRFAAQVMTDPAYYNICGQGTPLTSESLVQVIDGIKPLSSRITHGRSGWNATLMARNLLMHTWCRA